MTILDIQITPWDKIYKYTLNKDEPVPVEAMKYGQRVKVLGVGAPPILRDARALEVWGPRAFGLDRDFEPVETLAARP